MSRSIQPHNTPLRRLISAVLAAYWLLAAITVCAPMAMAESSTLKQTHEETTSSHMGMTHHMEHAVDVQAAEQEINTAINDVHATMDCCADNESHTTVTCETGVSDDGHINHINTDLDAPTLILLASYLAAAQPKQPPPYPQSSSEYHSTYPRLHLQLSVLLD